MIKKTLLLIEKSYNFTKYKLERRNGKRERSKFSIKTEFLL